MHLIGIQKVSETGLHQHYKFTVKNYRDIATDIYNISLYFKIFIYSMIFRGSLKGVLRHHRFPGNPGGINDLEEYLVIWRCVINLIPYMAASMPVRNSKRYE